MKNTTTTALTALLLITVGLVAQGCVASMDSDSEGEITEDASWQEEEESAAPVDEGEPEVVGTAEHAFVSQRSDKVATITPANGYWGVWKQNIYCNPGMWVAGYEMRGEASQGSGDDTALNSVMLRCRSKDGSRVEWISSYDGVWGGWNSGAYCSGAGNFVTSARVRMDPPQGDGDDTAANNVQLSCSAGGHIQAPGGMTWGDWGPWVFCPRRTAVCGLSIRFEDPQGDGDDTAMNGLRLHCCRL